MNIILYFSTLVTLALIDSVWLFSMGAQYKKWLGHVFAPSINFIPAILFYLLYAAGMVFFILLPAIRQEHSLIAVFFTGALFGLIAYATYDLTNHATIKEWPIIVTVLDLLWGAFMTGFASAIVFFLFNHFK